MQRYKQVRSNSSGTETLHYIGKTAEVSIKGSTTTTRLFIDDIAIISKTQQSGQSTASDAIRYTLRDRLGSVVSLTNEANTLSEHRSYDPFGKPRKGDYRQWNPATLTGVVGTTPFTSRGFTDHEHLDGAQLIHMNGRFYDCNLGRFYSVDPVIQAPGNSQSLNPYSYIMNNPLAGTDPTGYTAECVEQCPEPPKRSEPKKRSGRSFVQDIIYQRPNNGAVQNTKSIESKTDAGGIGSQQDVSKQDVSKQDGSVGDFKFGPDDYNYFLESNRKKFNDALTVVNALREELEPFEKEIDAAKWLNANAGYLQDRYGAEVGAIIAKVYGDKTGFRIGKIVTSYHSNYVDLSTSKIRIDKMDYIDDSIKNRADWHTHSSGSHFASWGEHRDSDKSYFRQYVSSVGSDGKPNLSLYNAPSARASSWPMTRDTFDNANTCLIGECR
ncbi:YD repeat-containing protein [Alishewanella agri BL06]|uniref:YD repeat-containing protein n=1 Tax=Alishewanella agri BL06 TaxID=1195246 RepID=I9DSL1_9ALTE|nr:RHS repeat-associated core domain-containing protein [Alishewanella agri]EIW89075.1 YD repeat-containing protein [Alishewanella agri BL06]